MAATYGALWSYLLPALRRWRPVKQKSVCMFLYSTRRRLCGIARAQESDANRVCMFVMFFYIYIYLFYAKMTILYQAELPELFVRVAVWLFISITERRGEADHSVMTKGTQGRTVTAAATSLTLRIPILEQRLAKATAKEFHRMADTFNVIRKPLAAIRTFGFVRHPYIVKGMAANESKEHLQTRFSRCMYAMDPHSHFLDTSKTRAKAEKAN